MSRLGGGVSPKRDCAGATVLLVELLPKRRGARLSESPSRLSKTLQPERRAGRECILSWFPSMLGCLAYACLSYCMMA